MAVTKIHPIKSTIQKSVDYITNPDKTDEQLLVTSFACSYQYAEMDFNTSLMHGMNRSNNNPAYHLIQSFLPGEISKNEAHKIGIELADEILKGKHSYIVSTHIDKDHVHNHIIFCAVNNIDYGAYHDCKSSYKNIRNTSDRLCREHGLHILDNTKQKGKNYSEWFAEKGGNSYKAILKMDIFDSIKKAKDYEDFISLMIEKGYQIKGQELGAGSPKYITFKPSNYERYIRGSYKNLGKGYTKEEIVEKIARQIASREAWIQKQKEMELSKRTLIDISSDKFKDNEGLKNWAETTNLQIAAATFAQIGSLSDLRDNIEESTKLQDDTNKSLKQVDNEIKEIGEAIKYLEQYTEYKPYNDKYIIAKDKEAYMRQNESQIILYAGAKGQLDRLGVDPGKISIEKLRDKYSELLEQKKELGKNQMSLRDKLNMYKQQQKTMDDYLGVSKHRKQDQVL